MAAQTKEVYDRNKNHKTHGLTGRPSNNCGVHTKKNAPIRVKHAFAQAYINNLCKDHSINSPHWLRKIAKYIDNVKWIRRTADGYDQWRMIYFKIIYI